MSAEPAAAKRVTASGTTPKYNCGSVSSNSEKIARNSGITAPFSFGSRTETRAYLAAMARFGRVNLQIVEGIEVDHEPYEVWAVHDKGFVQLQASF